MMWRDAQYLGSLARTQITIDDILKDFEAADWVRRLSQICGSTGMRFSSFWLMVTNITTLRIVCKNKKQTTGNETF